VEGQDTVSINSAKIKSTSNSNDTLKEYGITIQEMNSQMSRGLKPLTIEEQKRINKNIFVEDWHLKSDADFNKKVEVIIKNGSEMKEYIVALKITFLSDSCHLSTTLQSKINIHPNSTKKLVKELGKFECKTVNITHAECVLANGDMMDAKIPSTIERFMNRELNKTPAK
jgi:hypothetical protein